MIGIKFTYPCADVEGLVLTVQELGTDEKPLLTLSIGDEEFGGESGMTMKNSSIKLLHYQLGVYLDKIGEEKYELA